MIRFIASHPTVANILMIALIVIGLFALPNLNRETFPEFELERIQISVANSGSTAEEMEESVGQPIEDALAGIKHIDEIRATFQEGMASIVVDMADGGDLQTFLDDIRTEVDAITTLPSEANDPLIQILNRSTGVVSIAVTGSMSVQDLKEYCELLKRKLQRLPEISLVSVNGFSDRQIQIHLDGKKLSMLSLSVTEIADAISNQSFDLPVGSLETQDQEILLRFTEKSRSISEFANIVILSGATGAEVKLGEIATIEDRFELDENKTIFNGSRAGFVSVSRPKTGDSLEVYKVVEAFVKQEQAIAPQNVSLALTQNFASIIEDRLMLLLTNGWQGLLLVFLSMWLFFSFRLSFWVTMGLPVSFLASFFVMLQIGYTLNMMTTLALIIAIGLLMDDAIVIAENIAAHLQRGKSSVDAVTDGIKEVYGGGISSFLTTAFIFIPLGFIEGGMGRVLGVVSITLIIVLAFSLIEAFLILPNHLAHSLRKNNLSRPGKIRSFIEGMMTILREKILGSIVDRAVRWRYLTIGVAVMVFIISIGMLVSGKLKFKAFPDIEGDMVETRILFPQGTPLERTESAVNRVVTALKKVNDELTPLQNRQNPLVENIIVNYGKNSDSNESGAHQATVHAELLDPELRTSTLNQIQMKWRRAIGAVPDVITINVTPPVRGPAGVAIKVLLKGEDIDQLKLASLELSEWLNQIDGVYNVFDDLRPGKPEIRMYLSRGATVLGVNGKMIANQVRSAFYGTNVTEIPIGRESYEVNVRLQPQDRDEITDFENYSIKGPQGGRIPITNVVNLTSGRGYSRIAHVDGYTTLTLQADVDDQTANTAEIINRLKTEFFPQLNEQFPEIQTTLKGQMQRAQTAGASMGQLGFLGMLGIFGLLSFQFRNYTEPLVIMSAIPFALIGAIWGHILMDIPFTIPSMLGFISLAGVVVNDSILLVMFIKMQEKKGIGVVKSAQQASRVRFRAVFLTSLTTIAGLSPLLVEKSMHAIVLKPIATSLGFGLLASTVLVLVALPCIYTILYDFKRQTP